MHKKIRVGIIAGIIAILIVLACCLAKYGIEYISTKKRIKNSDTYNSNAVCVKYDKEYTIKIPKGLGDLELKGNVRYCFKSTKSVEKLKKEFEELYGSKNVRVEANHYYYMDFDEKYVVSVLYNDGFFSDVYITNVETIEKEK